MKQSNKSAGSSRDPKLQDLPVYSENEVVSSVPSSKVYYLLRYHEEYGAVTFFYFKKLRRFHSAKFRQSFPVLVSCLCTLYIPHVPFSLPCQAPSLEGYLVAQAIIYLISSLYSVATAIRFHSLSQCDLPFYPSVSGLLLYSFI